MKPRHQPIPIRQPHIREDRRRDLEEIKPRASNRDVDHRRIKLAEGGGVERVIVVMQVVDAEQKSSARVEELELGVVAEGAEPLDAEDFRTEQTGRRNTDSPHVDVHVERHWRRGAGVGIAGDEAHEHARRGTARESHWLGRGEGAARIDAGYFFAYVQQDGRSYQLLVRAWHVPSSSAGDVELCFRPGSERAGRFALGFGQACFTAGHGVDVLHSTRGGIRAWSDRRMAVCVLMIEPECVSQLMRSGAGKRGGDLPDLHRPPGAPAELIEDALEVGRVDVGRLAGDGVGLIRQ